MTIEDFQPLKERLNIIKNKGPFEIFPSESVIEPLIKNFPNKLSVEDYQLINECKKEIQALKKEIHAEFLTMKLLFTPYVERPNPKRPKSKIIGDRKRLKNIGILIIKSKEEKRNLALIEKSIIKELSYYILQLNNLITIDNKDYMDNLNDFHPYRFFKPKISETAIAILLVKMIKFGIVPTMSKKKYYGQIGECVFNFSQIQFRNRFVEVEENKNITKEQLQEALSALNKMQFCVEKDLKKCLTGK